MPELPLDAIGKFVALGGTYRSHLDEKEVDYRWPDLWVVPDAGRIGPGDPIVIPERVEDVKPGAELTAVIGEDLWNASEEEAWDAIEGFTLSNDVTAAGDWPGNSDPELKMPTGIGYKIFPTFSPIQTEYVSVQDGSFYDDLDVEVRVDGIVSASGNTEQLAFSIPECIAFASSVVELHENDVVALGDPGDPSIFLDDADEVICDIEEIGTLENPVRRADD